MFVEMACAASTNAVMRRCGGCRDETEHLPCLEPECIERRKLKIAQEVKAAEAKGVPSVGSVEFVYLKV